MPFEGPVRHGAAAGCQLIETMRWEPGTGIVRAKRHLRRLSRSAEELGFMYSLDLIEERLSRIAGGEAPLRVRLTLTRDGKANAVSQPFAPLPPDAVLKLTIAQTRLDRHDPLLRHKTTRREVYDRARAEFSREEADEVVLLNQDGRVCEGTITNVFVGDGGGLYLTPALGCGLLPGVLRAEMIGQGRAHEADITPDMLKAADEIFIGNSLRGLIRGKLVEEQTSP
jgi:4-amino-4-deoxychorismate lyase